MDIISIIAAVVGLAIGAVVTFLSTRKTNNNLVAIAEEKAHSIIKEAEAKGELFKKDKEIQAKDRFAVLKAEHEKHIAEKDKRILEADNSNFHLTRISHLILNLCCYIKRKYLCLFI